MDISLSVDTGVNDETLQASLAVYRSALKRRSRLTSGVLGGLLVPLLVAFALVFLCKRIHHTAAVSGLQQRRLAEGEQGDGGLSDEELQGMLQECIQAAQDTDVSHESGETPQSNLPLSGETHANVFADQFASLQDLEQPSTSAVSGLLIDEGDFVDTDSSPSLDDIWSLTADDLRFGEKDFGNDLEEETDIEQEDKFSSGNESSPLRSAEKRKLYFGDFSDDEDEIITGVDFWWGQRGNRGRAKRQRSHKKPAVPPPSKPKPPVFPEAFPVTRGPLKDHPLIRLPKVLPGAITRKLKFDFESIPQALQHRTQLRLLKEIRALFLEPELGSEEIERLMLLAEALFYRESSGASIADPGSRPSHILERVASDFMVFDVLVCTMHLVGQAKDLEKEWKKFIALHKIHYEFPESTRHGHYTQAKVKQNVRWARRISAALEIYEKGSRPPAAEVVAIKKMIMSNPSIRRFAGAAGQVWRDDLEGFSSKETGGDATGESSTEKPQ
ncbi:hypothetical protein Emed_004046 [Eimeria media]